MVPVKIYCAGNAESMQTLVLYFVLKTIRLATETKFCNIAPSGLCTKSCSAWDNSDYSASILVELATLFVGARRYTLWSVHAMALLLSTDDFQLSPFYAAQ